MRSANLFFFTQPQETFQDWLQGHQNEGFEEKVEPFFAEFQQIPINYGTITDTAYQDSLYWKEQHLYGSSRLGIAKPELEVTNYKNSNFSLLTSNFKNYELTNHLGNVLATIKDEKQQKDDNNDGIVDYYEPIVITANDYYPFGMVMPNRSFSLAGSGYRFGFNTQEKDDEVYGAGNLNTALFWEYDTRIGRRWNVDPKPDVSISPYAVFRNNPIWFNDIHGDVPNHTVGEVLKTGREISKTFNEISKGIQAKNFKQVSENGKTETDIGNAQMFLRDHKDIKQQIIGATHEITNRKMNAESQKVVKQAQDGKITADQYADKLINIEVEGQINQIKVASEIGYKYNEKEEITFGTSQNVLRNQLIEEYKANPNVDLKSRVMPNEQERENYKKQGQKIITDFKQYRKKLKEHNEKYGTGKK